MCGIAGLVQKIGIDLKKTDKFVCSCKLMHHRGPDFIGVETFQNLTLVHLRLSIIDLDARSNQPFKSKNKKFVCTYNGEIYNYLDLKERFSHEWRTTSDTEVMLEQFALHKEKAVSSWNGMFSIGILDRSENLLYLIRDRLGIKPLYFYEDNEVILFSSESKVILKYLDQFRLNYSGVHQFVWFGNTTGNETQIENLVKLPPASITKINLNDFKKATSIYWDSLSINKIVIDEQSAINELYQRINNAVKRQLMGDVPIGILLSGGVDSSGIVAIAALNSSRSLDTYSIEYDYNIDGKSELKKARKVADKFRTNHHELMVTTEDVRSIFESLVFQFDEPFSDPGAIPLYQLAKTCGTSIKVVLQGDGGDELFGGYSRSNVINSLYFWKYFSQLNFLLPIGRKKERLQRLAFILNQTEQAELLSYYSTVEVPYKDPLAIFTRDFSQNLRSSIWNKDYRDKISSYGSRSLLEKQLLIDFEILLGCRYLEKVDKATMFSSIEARVPYLDNDLVDFSISLPSSYKVRYNTGKYILKKALKDLLPKDILYGKKRGFDVPYRHWLRNDLYSFAMDVVKNQDSNVIDHSIFEKRMIEHRNFKLDHGDLLWKVIVLSYWMNHYKSKVIF